MAEVGADLSGIFTVHREQAARELAQAFLGRYTKRFRKLRSPSSANVASGWCFSERLGETFRRSQTTNVDDWHFPEREKRGKSLYRRAFAGDRGGGKRYLDMEPLRAMNQENEGKN